MNGVRINEILLRVCVGIDSRSVMKSSDNFFFFPFFFIFDCYDLGSYCATRFVSRAKFVFLSHGKMHVTLLKKVIGCSCFLQKMLHAQKVDTRYCIAYKMPRNCFLFHFFFFFRILAERIFEQTEIDNFYCLNIFPFQICLHLLERNTYRTYIRTGNIFQKFKTIFTV